MTYELITIRVILLVIFNLGIVVRAIAEIGKNMGATEDENPKGVATTIKKYIVVLIVINSVAYFAAVIKNYYT